MKTFTILGILSTAVIASANLPALFSLDQVSEITNNKDGTYKVLCLDQTVEQVSKQDLIDENVCPHTPAVTPIGQLDVLFVIDNSGSMMELQNEFSLQARPIIDKLIENRVDFKIAVTTTDAYDTPFGVGTRLLVHDGVRYITNQTPAPSHILANFITQGTEGRGVEKALDSILAVLQDPENDDFRRQSTPLQIVFLGDEDDQSEMTTDEFLSEMDIMTGSTPISRSYKIHTSAILTEDCLENFDRNGGFYGRTIAERMMTLSAETAGKQTSICEMDVPL